MTGVQTCALPIFNRCRARAGSAKDLVHAPLGRVVVRPQAPLALVTVAELSRDHAPRHRIDIDARVATEQDPINLSLDLVVSVPERRPSSVAIAELAGDDPLRKL